MKITDCVWEISNIGKKTCEVVVDEGDTIDDNLLSKLDTDYEYQVFKVAPNNIATNFFLGDKGFHFIETQIEIELKYKDFNFNDPLVKYLEPDIIFKDVIEKDEFEAIFNRMTPNMFISDRLAVDPYFGIEYSYKRYSNWMRTAFNNKTASFFHILYKGEPVGFSMYRITDDVWHGDLGGVYPGFGAGLGLLTACCSFYYIKQRGIKIKKLVSAISSNNIPVIPTFNHCHFNFKNFKYIFVKHNDTI